MPITLPELESPEDQLNHAISILEDERADFNLIAGIYHRPNSNDYCVQGLLLELSGQGYWQHGALDNYTFCSYIIDGKPRFRHEMFYLYRDFLADYYSLGEPPSKPKNHGLRVDISKLPDDLLESLRESMDTSYYGELPFIGNINNDCVRKGNPRAKEILAYILRHKLFV